MTVRVEYVSLLQRAYTVLLSLPLASRERIHAQKLMFDLREQLSREFAKSPEEIQLEFEQLAKDLEQ